MRTLQALALWIGVVALSATTGTVSIVSLIYAYGWYQGMRAERTIPAEERAARERFLDEIEGKGRG